jgi:hypothetical protein
MTGLLWTVDRSEGLFVRYSHISDEAAGIQHVLSQAALRNLHTTEGSGDSYGIRHVGPVVPEPMGVRANSSGIQTNRRAKGPA